MDANIPTDRRRKQPQLNYKTPAQLSLLPNEDCPLPQSGNTWRHNLVNHRFIQKTGMVATHVVNLTVTEPTAEKSKIAQDLGKDYSTQIPIL